MNTIRDTMVTMWERVFNDYIFVSQRSYQHLKMVLKGNNIHFKRKTSVIYGAQLLASMHSLYYLGCSLPNHKNTTSTSVSMASFMTLTRLSFPFPFLSPNLTLPIQILYRSFPVPAHSSVVSYPSGFQQHLLSDLHNFNLILFVHFILVP